MAAMKDEKDIKILLDGAGHAAPDAAPSILESRNGTRSQHGNFVEPANSSSHLFGLEGDLDPVLPGRRPVRSCFLAPCRDFDWINSLSLAGGFLLSPSPVGNRTQSRSGSGLHIALVFFGRQPDWRRQACPFVRVRVNCTQM